MFKHQAQKVGVLVREVLIDALLLVLPLFALLEKKHADGKRQADNSHQIAQGFQPFERAPDGHDGFLGGRERGRAGQHSR